MKKLIVLLYMCLTILVNAQNFKEQKIQSEIKAVTVFYTGAQIFEQASVNIFAGFTTLKIINLSPYIDVKSIHAELNGDVTILSVNHSLNHVSELNRQAPMDSLNSKIKVLQDDINNVQARWSVLKEKSSLLDENKKIGSQQTGLTMSQLQLALDFYEVELTKIKKEESKLEASINTSKSKINLLEMQIKAAHDQKYLPSGEIEIKVKSDKNLWSNVNVSYMVAHAGWYPKYDIRVKNVNSPLELVFKAEVFQNTGVDWKNIKLKFSNSNPNQSGTVPNLKSWNLNYAKYTVFEKVSSGQLPGQFNSVYGMVVDNNNEPLIGATVLVKGSNIGCVTDIEGKYQLSLPKEADYLEINYLGFQSQTIQINKAEINVKLLEGPKLDEVVITALSGSVRGMDIKSKAENKSIQSTIVVETQATIEVEILEPYSIQANGEKLMVDLKKHFIEAFYKHVSIPKLDKDAFLIAQIKNWSQYQLLQGEANLYYEDAYVGRTVIESGIFQDTMEISLGRDKNIQIKREKNEQFQKTKFIGTNTVDTRGFKIMILNRKSFPIHLKLMDQIPVPLINDIEVHPIELSNGWLDEKTGIISWELTLDPKQQKEIDLRYEVKYPKREKVLLE